MTIIVQLTIDLGLAAVFTSPRPFTRFLSAEGQWLFAYRIALTGISLPRHYFASGFMAGKGFLVIRTVNAKSIVILVCICGRLLTVGSVETIITFVAGRTLNMIRIEMSRLRFRRITRLAKVNPDKTSTLEANYYIPTDYFGLHVETI